MRTVLLGYHNFGCLGLEALLRHGYEVAAVFTHPDQPSETPWFRSLAREATRLGIPVYAPEDINHPLWVERLRELAPEVLFSFYYRHLVKPEVLAIPSRGCLNLHGSYLPEYRGRCPINWAILEGRTETGVTLHEMVEAADAGDIVAQRKVPIGPDDSARDVHERMLEVTETMLDEVLPEIAAGTAPRTPQDTKAASYRGGRGPADGEIDWQQPATAIRNLIRAVTHPYPGAFTYLRDEQLMVWWGTVVDRPAGSESAAPGTIVCCAPLVVACGEGALRIDQAQFAGGVWQSGAQVAEEQCWQPGVKLGPHAGRQAKLARPHRVVILGANGFIGNALSEVLLERGYEIFGMDLSANRLDRFADHPRFHFAECDIAIHEEWLEYHIRKSDTILPLVAIATPASYVKDPLGVFKLDFEENLRVIRLCHKYGKRVVFPSTSEVYGMCPDEEFDENNSPLVLGPINKPRWIYSCSKQLLDRLLQAYGMQEGLRYTIFRPFNWIGPRLDSLQAARIGSSRALTQLVLNLVQGAPIKLVDGGHRRRCFTDVRDGVDALVRIVERPERCNHEIINIGNPHNELSIRQLGEHVVEAFERHPLAKEFPPFAGFQEIESSRFYGKGYQDLDHRKPSIRQARRLLGWRPQHGLEEAIGSTLDFFLHEALAERGLPAGDHDE